MTNTNETNNDTGDAATRGREDESGGGDATGERDGDAGGARRELLLMESGGRRFAVFAEEVDCTAEGRAPTPLPHAPHAVVGVVSVRGRMRTVLDAAALLAQADGEGGGKEAATNEKEVTAGGGAARFCVALRGDEQLALAAERVRRVEAAAGEIRVYEGPRGVARGTFTTDALEVPLLDAARLFEAAVRGAERRRKR